MAQQYKTLLEQKKKKKESNPDDKIKKLVQVGYRSYLLDQSWVHQVRALRPPVASICCGEAYQKEEK